MERRQSDRMVAGLWMVIGISNLAIGVSYDHTQQTAHHAAIAAMQQGEVMTAQLDNGDADSAHTSILVVDGLAATAFATGIGYLLAEGVRATQDQKVLSIRRITDMASSHLSLSGITRPFQESPRQTTPTE